MKSKTIHYYIVVVGFPKKIIPLLQAALSEHSIPVIKEWLDQWLSLGRRIPKKISTDGSLALQNSINLSFNKMTFQNYNLQCYKIMKNETEEIPNCFYRHDINHLIFSCRK